MLAGLTNSPEFKSFINNDALKEDPKAFERIHLVDDDGGKWEVQASKSSLYYRVGQAKYEKVGRKNLFELCNQQIPGLLYDPEDSRQIMNLQGEDDGLFPIDRSDSQIFKTYERLLSLSSTEDVLKTIKLDKEDIEYKKSDLLNSIQKGSTQLEEIDKCLKEIENCKVDSKVQIILYLKELYSRLCTGLNASSTLHNYIATLSAYSLSNTDSFDVGIFQNLLNDLMKASSLSSYCNIVNSYKSTIDYYDLATASSLFNSYNKALCLANDLQSLKSEIIKDQKALQGIISILQDIDTCPYCGRPMEGN